MYFTRPAVSGSAYVYEFRGRNANNTIVLTHTASLPSPYTFSKYAITFVSGSNPMTASTTLLSIGKWEAPATRSVPVSFFPPISEVTSGSYLPVVFRTGSFYHNAKILASDLVRSTLAAAPQIGIGTTSPSVTCHVYGPRYDTNYPSNLWLMDSTTSTGSNVGGGVGFGFRYDGSTPTLGSVIQGGKENSTSGNVRGTLRFLTRADAGISEKMRIDSSGKVGIGTTTPVNLVEVSAAGLNGTIYEKITLTGATQNFATSGSGQIIGFRGISYFGAVGGYGSGNNGGVGLWGGRNSGPPDLFVINSKSGFGTLNPTQRLSVAGNLDFPDGNGVVFTSDPLYQGYYFIRNSAWNVGMEYAHYTAHKFMRSTGSVAVMTIDTINSKVGINGAPDATAKLYVAGDTNLNGQLKLGVTMDATIGSTGRTFYKWARVTVDGVAKWFPTYN
jgi:hypothetical protein